MKDTFEEMKTRWELIAISREHRGASADYLLAVHEQALADKLAQPGGAGSFLEIVPSLRRALARNVRDEVARAALTEWIDGAVKLARQFDARELAEAAAQEATPDYTAAIDASGGMRPRYTSAKQVRANEGETWVHEGEHLDDHDPEYEYAGAMRRQTDGPRVVVSGRVGDRAAIFSVDAHDIPDAWRIAQQSMATNQTFQELFAQGEVATAGDSARAWRESLPEITRGAREAGRGILTMRVNLDDAIAAHGPGAVNVAVTLALLDGVEQAVERASRSANPAQWWPNAIGRRAHVRRDAVGRPGWTQARGAGGQQARRRELPGGMTEVEAADGARVLPSPLATLAYPPVGVGGQAMAICDELAPMLERAEVDSARAFIDAMRAQTPEVALSARKDALKVLSGALGRAALVDARGDQVAGHALTHAMLEVASRATTIVETSATLEHLTAGPARQADARADEPAGAPSPTPEARLAPDAHALLDVQIARYNVEIKEAMGEVAPTRQRGYIGPWREPTWQIARGAMDPDRLVVHAVMISPDGRALETYRAPTGHPADTLDALAASLGAPSAAAHLPAGAPERAAQHARDALNARTLGEGKFTPSARRERTPEQMRAFARARAAAVFEGAAARAGLPARVSHAQARAQEILADRAPARADQPGGVEFGALIASVERAQGARIRVMGVGESARGAMFPDPVVTDRGTFDVMYSTRGEFVLIPGGPRDELRAQRGLGLTDVEVGPLPAQGRLPVRSADPRAAGALYASATPEHGGPSARVPAMPPVATAPAAPADGARAPVGVPQAPSRVRTARHNRAAPAIRDTRPGGFASWQGARWQVACRPGPGDEQGKQERHVATIRAISADGTRLITYTPPEQPAKGAPWWAREHADGGALRARIARHGGILHPRDLEAAGFTQTSVELGPEQRRAVARERARVVVEGLAVRGSGEQPLEQASARLARATGFGISVLEPGGLARGSVLPTPLVTSQGRFDVLHTRDDRLVLIPGGPRPELDAARKDPRNDTAVARPAPERGGEGATGPLSVVDAAGADRRPKATPLPSLSQAVCSMKARLSDPELYVAPLVHGESVTGRLLPDRVATRQGTFHVVETQAGNRWFVPGKPGGALDRLSATPQARVCVTRPLEGDEVRVDALSNAPSRGR